MREGRWTKRFAVPPEAAWRAVADTARFNEAAGLPRQRITDLPQPDGSVAYLGEAKFGPVTVAWDEEPVEWISGRWFRHARRFRNGPLRDLVASLTLEPDGEGSRADYVVAARPRGLAGRALLAGGFLRAAGRSFERLTAEAEGFLAGKSAVAFAPPAPALDAAAQAWLDAAVAAMAQAGADPALAGRLARHVRVRGEVDLARIRPLALAREWGVPPRAAIETALHGVRAGLLELHWDLLCPNCRGAKAAAGSLDRLPTGAHCGTCNIDYGRDFARNVELSFRPAPAIRAIAGGEFCLFGPMNTPHVVAQITLAPGETRDLPAPLTLKPGAWRVRGLHQAPGEEVDWRGGGFPAVVADEGTVAAGAAAADGTVRFVNRRARPATLVIEAREWVQDALTAARVTALQAFRDLFASEALRPGDDVGVGRLALLFTDLGGSTALYARMGDAAAYRLVREHFAFLADAVRSHDGAIVKTIGDAVMAAFADPAQAVAASLTIQRGVAAFNARSGGALAIKLGAHVGPAIAVTLNDRLDYFGQTVNLAARLQMESRGGDIVLSDALAAEPGVAALIEAVPATRETAPIKGFAEPIAYRRLRVE